ncbi:MAG: hypothetical protein RBS57_03620, partial [Desulforhabdus sp.]|nr:hypothetical protein [Desulforhabdus sp.]
RSSDLQPDQLPWHPIQIQPTMMYVELFSCMRCGLFSRGQMVRCTRSAKDETRSLFSPATGVESVRVNTREVEEPIVMLI